MNKILLLFSMSVLSGCAALFNANSEEVRFTSEPSGARVFVDGNPIGRTPTSTTLQASENHQIRFSKEGFEERAVMLNYHVGAGWVILDILTALIPIIIDAATESWYELDQNDIHAVLSPSKKAL